jgi:hypothetical protein
MISTLLATPVEKKKQRPLFLVFTKFDDFSGN